MRDLNSKLPKRRVGLAPDLKSSYRVRASAYLGYCVPSVAIWAVVVLLSAGLSVLLVSLQGSIWTLAAVILVMVLAIGSQSLAPGRWAILIMCGYVLLVFGVRSIYIVGHQLELNTSLSLSNTEFESYLVLACGLGAIGLVSVCLGYRLGERSVAHRSTSKSTYLVVAPMTLWLFIAVGALCAVFLVAQAGGVGAALGRANTVRSELAGSLFPLFGIWSAQCCGLLVTATPQANRWIRSVGVLVVVTGSVVSLLIGSRGSALPPLIALAILIAVRPLTVKGWQNPASSAMRRLILLIAPVVIVGGMAGIARYQAVADSLNSTHQSSAISGPLYQFSEVDNFALSLAAQRDFPSSAEQIVEVLKFPLLVVPRNLGLPKPVPYDFLVREAVLGGIVETGLPASLFGELWLLGGLVGVIGGGAFTGFVLAWSTSGIARRGPKSSTWSALVLGHTYLLFSRPLDLSLSRLLAFGIALLLVVSLCGGVSRKLARQ
jgi:hypothetical protein